MKKLLLFVSLCLILGCKKNRSDIPFIEVTPLSQASEMASSSIQNAISNNTFVDIAALVNNLKSLKGIKNVWTVDNSSISLELENGFVNNISLVAQDDLNVFKLSTAASWTIKSSIAKNTNILKQQELSKFPISHLSFQNIEEKKSLTNISINGLPSFPTTITPPYQISTNIAVPKSKKALILAPFQKSFNQEIEALKEVLETAGYETTLLTENVNPEQFNGNYLADFGVIYISTHGDVSKNFSSSPYTILSTNKPYHYTDSYQFTNPVTAISIDDGPSAGNYYAVGISYIKQTLTKKFPNSLVFIDACLSAKLTDLRDFFLQNGASCFIGYTQSINSYDADPLAIETFAFLAQGYDMNTSLKLVYNYQGMTPVNLKTITNDVSSAMNSLSASGNVRLKNNVDIYTNTGNYGKGNIGDLIPIEFKAKASVYNNMLDYQGESDVTKGSWLYYSFYNPQYNINLFGIAPAGSHFWTSTNSLPTNIDWDSKATISYTLKIYESDISKSIFPRAVPIFVWGKRNSQPIFKTVTAYTIVP